MESTDYIASIKKFSNYSFGTAWVMEKLLISVLLLFFSEKMHAPYFY